MRSAFAALLFALTGLGQLQAQWSQVRIPDGRFTENLASSGTNLMVQTLHQLFSPDNGATWTEPKTAGRDVNALVALNGNLFAGGYEGVFLSRDNGASWTPVKAGLQGAPVAALAVSGANLYAGTQKGIFLSRNNGTSWTAVNTGLPSTSVNALAVSGTKVFAATDEGVFLSTNDGASWRAVKIGFLMRVPIHALAVSGTNIFAATGSGVFRSRDNGTSWTAVSRGATEFQVYTVNSLAVSGTKLFVGVEPGNEDDESVLLSTDNGASWKGTGLKVKGQNSGGLPWNDIVYDLAVSGTTLFARTLSNGVWKLQIGASAAASPPAPNQVANDTSGESLLAALEFALKKSTELVAADKAAAADAARAAYTPPAPPTAVDRVKHAPVSGARRATLEAKATLTTHTVGSTVVFPDAPAATIWESLNWYDKNGYGYFEREICRAEAGVSALVLDRQFPIVGNEPHDAMVDMLKVRLMSGKAQGCVGWVYATNFPKVAAPIVAKSAPATTVAVPPVAKRDMSVAEADFLRDIQGTWDCTLTNKGGAFRTTMVIGDAMRDEDALGTVNYISAVPIRGTPRRASIRFVWILGITIRYDNTSDAHDFVFAKFGADRRTLTGEVTDREGGTAGWSFSATKR